MSSSAQRYTGAPRGLGSTAGLTIWNTSLSDSCLARSIANSAAVSECSASSMAHRIWVTINRLLRHPETHGALVVHITKALDGDQFLRMTPGRVILDLG